jgi:hypothetical protein
MPLDCESARFTHVQRLGSDARMIADRLTHQLGEVAKPLVGHVALVPRTA